MSNVQGIYFNEQRRLIMAVDTDAGAPGAPWTRFTDDHRLGLLAARRELERLGIMDDAHGVEWYGMSVGDPGQRRRVSTLIRDFREDSENRRREAEIKQEFWQRLVSFFKSPLHSGEEV
jgi:hypothetical protein